MQLPNDIESKRVARDGPTHPARSPLVDYTTSRL